MFIKVILFVTKGSVDGIQLTHRDLYEVACRLTRIYDIQRLALKLGVQAHRMASILVNNNGDITEAAYEMLKEWRSSQQDAVEALSKLWDALTHPDVNLQQVAQAGSFKG